MTPNCLRLLLAVAVAIVAIALIPSVHGAAAPGIFIDFEEFVDPNVVNQGVLGPDVSARLHGATIVPAPDHFMLDSTKALSFNGPAAFVEFEDSSVLALPPRNTDAALSQYSVSVWFKITKRVRVAQTIFARGTDSTRSQSVVLGVQPDDRLGCSVGGAVVLSANPVVALNAWSLITVTNERLTNGTWVFKLYGNGTLLGTGRSGTAVSPAGSTSTLGARRSNTGAIVLPFSGYMDNFRYFPYPISPFHVDGLFVSGLNFTLSPTPSGTPAPSATVSVSASSSATASLTSGSSPSQTSSVSLSATQSPTVSDSATPTASITATVTRSTTLSRTSTRTASETVAPSPSGTPSATASAGFSGCTDPNAQNYNPLSIVDDGSCTFADCTQAEPLSVVFNTSAGCAFQGFSCTGYPPAIVDGSISTCKFTTKTFTSRSVGDPHVTTLQGTYYDNYDCNDYILLDCERAADAGPTIGSVFPFRYAIFSRQVPYVIPGRTANSGLIIHWWNLDPASFDYTAQGSTAFWPQYQADESSFSKTIISIVGGNSTESRPHVFVDCADKTAQIPVVSSSTDSVSVASVAPGIPIVITWSSVSRSYTVLFPNGLSLSISSYHAGSRNYLNYYVTATTHADSETYGGISGEHCVGSLGWIGNATRASLNREWYTDTSVPYSWAVPSFKVPIDSVHPFPQCLVSVNSVYGFPNTCLPTHADFVEPVESGTECAGKSTEVLAMSRSCCLASLGASVVGTRAFSDCVRDVCLVESCTPTTAHVGAQTIQTQIQESTIANVSSCLELLQSKPSLLNQNGLYAIRPPTPPANAVNGTVQVYCDMTTSGGGWTRVVNIDPEVNCPPEWSSVDLDGNGQVCKRPDIDVDHDNNSLCSSASFSTFGIPFKAVRGTLQAVSYGTPLAFSDSADASLDEFYVDGVSLTYTSANNRSHLWTYAIGSSDTGDVASGAGQCPCSAKAGASSPSFVGDNWYCESGNPTGLSPANEWHLTQLLFGGESCFETGSSCCSRGTNPVFERVFGSSVTSEVETRICTGFSMNIGLFNLELFVRESEPDLDVDGDGLRSSVDNCPTVYNPTQENVDGDEFGDACDPCVNLATNLKDTDGLCVCPPGFYDNGKGYCVEIPPTPEATPSSTPSISESSSATSSLSESASVSVSRSVSRTPTRTPPACEIDSTVRSLQSPSFPVYTAGDFGSAPWYQGSFFVDRAAVWIWNTPNAQISAPATDSATLQYLYSSDECTQATVHVLVDNSGSFSFDGALVGPIAANSWGSTGYSRFSIRIVRGTHLFSFDCQNTGGSAGLLVSVVRDSDGAVLFRSDSTWSSFILPSITPTVTPIVSSSPSACVLSVGCLDTPARSCNAIKAMYFTAASGMYYIRPDASQPIQYVYCDMTRNGGGWTLVARVASGTSDLHRDRNAVGYLSSPQQSTTAKLTDTFINALRASGSGAVLNSIFWAESESLTSDFYRESRLFDALGTTNSINTVFDTLNDALLQTHPCSGSYSSTKHTGLVGWNCYDSHIYADNPGFRFGPLYTAGRVWVKELEADPVCPVESTSLSLSAPNSPVFVNGPFGISPWGSGSSFADPTASWIWHTANAHLGAPTTADVVIQASLNNPVCGSVKVHALVDNTADFYLDGALVGSVASQGWTTRFYSQFSLELTRGTHVLQFVVANTGLQAGLLVSVIRDHDGAVLLHSDADSWSFYVPPSQSPSPSQTGSVSAPPSVTASSSKSISVSSSASRTISVSPTSSSTISVSATASISEGASVSATGSVSRSSSSSRTPGACSLSVGCFWSPGTSCNSIKLSDPTVTDGLYYIRPNPSQPITQVYCDMTRLGGGWTLIARAAPGWSSLHRNQGAVGSLTSPMQTTTAKLSDNFINAIRTASSDSLINSIFWAENDAPTMDFFRDPRVFNALGYTSSINTVYNTYAEALSFSNPCSGQYNGGYHTGLVGWRCYDQHLYADNPGFRFGYDFSSGRVFVKDFEAFSVTPTFTASNSASSSLTVSISASSSSSTSYSATVSISASSSRTMAPSASVSVSPSPCDRAFGCPSNPGTTCNTIKLANSSSPDGMYYIKPLPSSPIQYVYCDMTRNGGGWTLVARPADGSTGALRTRSAVGALTSPTQSTTAKLSDEIINAIRISASGSVLNSVIWAENDVFVSDYYRDPREFNAIGMTSSINTVYDTYADALSFWQPCSGQYNTYYHTGLVGWRCYDYNIFADNPGFRFGPSYSAGRVFVKEFTPMSVTPSPSASNTASVSKSISVSGSVSASISESSSNSATSSISLSNSASVSYSRTVSVSVSVSKSPSVSMSPTMSISASPTPSVSASPCYLTVGCASNPGITCNTIKLANATSPNGMYFIKPLPSSSVQYVYCDMTRNGGGWTLVARPADGSTGALRTRSAVGVLTSATQSTTAKLSDDFINAIRISASGSVLNSIIWAENDVLVSDYYRDSRDFNAIGTTSSINTVYDTYSDALNFWRPCSGTYNTHYHTGLVGWSCYDQNIFADNPGFRFGPSYSAGRVWIKEFEAFSVTPTPSGSISRTPSMSISVSVTSSATPSRSAAATVSTSVSASVTAAVTPSRTPAASSSRTRSPTRSASPTSEPSVSPSQSSSVTPSATPSRTATSSISESSTPSVTASQSASVTSAVTPSQTPTSSISESSTSSVTASQSASETASVTPSRTATSSVSESPTSSVTPSASATSTSTISESSTSSATASISHSPTSSLTASPSASTSLPASVSPSSTATSSATVSPTSSESRSSSVTISFSGTSTVSISLSSSSSTSPTASISFSPTISVSASPSVCVLAAGCDYNPGKSCGSIKLLIPAAVDGIYYIQPNSSFSVAAVYCDMTTDGGGWTLVARIADGSTAAHRTRLALGTLTSPTQTSTSKLDDAYINAIRLVSSFSYIDSIFRAENDASVADYYRDSRVFDALGTTSSINTVYDVLSDALAMVRPCSGSYNAGYHTGLVGWTCYNMNIYADDPGFRMDAHQAGRVWLKDLVAPTPTPSASVSISSTSSISVSISLSQTSSSSPSISFSPTPSTSSPATKSISISSSISLSLTSSLIPTPSLTPSISLSPSTAAIPRSCNAIKLANSLAANGIYTIKPTSGVSAISVYCDMTRNGGGWTLVARVADGSTGAHRNQAAVGVLTGPSQSTTAKLSDSFINTLRSAATGNVLNSVMWAENDALTADFFRDSRQFNSVGTTSSINTVYDVLSDALAMVRPCSGSYNTGYHTGLVGWGCYNYHLYGDNPGFRFLNTYSAGRVWVREF